MKKYKAKWSYEKLRTVSELLQDILFDTGGCSSSHESMLLMSVLHTISHRLAVRLADVRKKEYRISFQPDQALALLLLFKTVSGKLGPGNYIGAIIYQIRDELLLIYPKK